MSLKGREGRSARMLCCRGGSARGRLHGPPLRGSASLPVVACSGHGWSSGRSALPLPLPQGALGVPEGRDRVRGRTDTASGGTLDSGSVSANVLQPPTAVLADQTVIAAVTLAARLARTRHPAAGGGMLPSPVLTTQTPLPHLRMRKLRHSKSE